MISDNEQKKKRLYTHRIDGFRTKVEWDNLPYWRKVEILESRENFKNFLIAFPAIFIITAMIICLLILFS